MNVVLPTKDEANAIRGGDRETINRFYMANYGYITQVAKSYCRRVNFYGWEDMAHEVYLHFDKIAFDSPAYFGHDLFKIFAAYRFGGQRKRDQLRDSSCGIEICVLDKPIQGEEKEVTTVGASLASDFDMMDEIEPRPDISESLFDYLCGYLSPERKRVFSRFYWTGETYNEVAQALGKNARTVKRTREEVFKKFRQNSAAIREWLCNVGYYETAV